MTNTKALALFNVLYGTSKIATLMTLQERERLFFVLQVQGTTANI